MTEQGAYLIAGDLVDGRIRVRRIPATSGSCVVTLGAAGSITAAIKLPMRDPQTGVVVPFLDLVVPGKSFLGYVEGGRIMNAGPIWNDQWDNDKSVLTLNAAGVLSYYDHRYVLPVLAGLLPSQVVSAWTAMSLRTIAKRLVQQAQAWTLGSLPIVLEADFAGDAERTYPGAELHVISEKLDQLRNVINGPDIQFRPQFQTDPSYIEWAMLTGNPELTQQYANPAAPDWVWDTTVPVPSVRGVKVTRDASQLSTNDYQLGSPPLEALAVDPTLTNLDYPMLESSTSRDSVTSGTAILQEYADEAVFKGRHHVETFSFEAKKDVHPRIGSFNEGDYARLVFKNNPRFGTGRPRMRIVSYSTSLASQFVKIDCAPERVRS